MSQDALLAALRLSANAPAAALDLLQEAHWAPRQQLCQILGNILTHGDWLTLLPMLNHEQAAIRLHWLASLLVDAQKGSRGLPLSAILMSGLWSISWPLRCRRRACRRSRATSAPAASSC